MSNIYYEVNSKRFNNQFLAHHEAYKSNCKIVFYCYDSQYDLYNWITESEYSFEQLMDMHAFRLRNKYSYLILNWSGGTDSHTIYNVFKRNKIHIDEICVKYSDIETEFFPKANADWLLNNHWDPTTKLSVVKDQDPTRRIMALNNEEWIFNDIGDFRRYGFSGVDISDMTLLRDRLGNSSWAIIAGFEKPKVYEYNGNWYASMPDYSLRAALGYDNLECFFLEPSIHMKQCHMLKNFMKSHTPIGNKYEYEYYTEATATGRHSELSTGISLGQKQKNRNNQKNTLIDMSTKISDIITPDILLNEN